MTMIAIALATACAGTSTRQPPDGASPAASAATAPSTSTSQTPVPGAAAPCLSADEVQVGQVTFTVADGTPVKGLMLGQGLTGVVLAHQAGEDLCQWKPYASALARRGYRVLVPNLSTTTDQVVVAAAALLRARGSVTVALIGASMGGTAVLAATRQIRPPVAAVVSLSAPQAYNGVEAMPAVRTMTVPVLFAASQGDTSFADDARALYAATPGSGRQLVIVDGDAHGVELMTPAFTATLEQFLARHAPSTGGTVPASS
jgi:pimeloyl-ACP methyl ester carboxylesterase